MGAGLAAFLEESAARCVSSIPHSSPLTPHPSTLTPLEAAGLERERALTLAPRSVDGMLRAMRTVGRVGLRRLQPYVVEAATLCVGGCNPMHDGPRRPA